MKKVLIYTDGACSGNPGKGGWAAILSFGSVERELSGYEPDTTNNRMELTAAIEGLKALKENCEVELYSDSAYLVNGFRQGWLENWKANGWRNKSRDEVKNIDLWKELDGLNSKHKISWIKVKGHSDNEKNNRCDKLATGEIKNHANVNINDNANDNINDNVNESDN
ncbi:MAG: ribonuclease HI [Clostridiales bacterium]|nr:ribonuclease HI [Clostridiales bacterium]